MLKTMFTEKNKSFKALVSLCLAFALCTMLAACGGGASTGSASTGTESTGVAPAQEDTATAEATEAGGTIRLATTTSTKDSGLLDEILPLFTQETGIEVEVISVGSGEAMALGEAGEADVLLVHSPAAELTFVEEGHADETGRLNVMYNDYVIVGPAADAAGIKTTAPADAVAAFTEIANAQEIFISRGDESGTHKKELSLWEKAALTPEGDWYVIAGSGMGAVITMANEMQGYTLADRATWLSNSSKTELEIVSEKDPSGILNNQYGVICVDPGKNAAINHSGAVAFQNWITSAATQHVIGEFGAAEFGDALFVPNAGK